MIHAVLKHIVLSVITLCGLEMIYTIGMMLLIYRVVGIDQWTAWYESNPVRIDFQINAFAIGWLIFSLFLTYRMNVWYAKVRRAIWEQQ